MTGDRRSPIGSDFANPILIARHRLRNRHRLAATSRLCMWSGRTTQALIWKGARARTCRTASRSASIFATKQVYGKEEGPAWNPIAAIIRYIGSMHNAERRNALRCSALRLLGRRASAPLDYPSSRSTSRLHHRPNDALTGCPEIAFMRL
jgi:hypothetical protein